jgi:methylmalonyl-CoA mutase
MAGVAIDSILDMRTLFDGIPLDKMSVSMTMNGAVLPGDGALHRRGEEQGVSPEQLAGHDPERHPQGVHGPQHLHLPARSRAMRIIGDIFALHQREHAAVQLDLASPATTCRKPARRRTSSWPTRSPTASSMCAPGSPRAWIDAFAPRLSFFWAIGMNFFMEVAKLRAAACSGRRSSSSSAEEPEEPERCARTARPRAGR